MSLEISTYFFAATLFTAFWCGMGCCAAGFLICNRFDRQREERARAHELQAKVGPSSSAEDV